MKQIAIFLIATCAIWTGARAQIGTEAPAQDASWLVCTRLNDAPARLACFDRWAGQQAPALAVTPRPAPPALASEHLPPTARDATAAPASATATEHPRQTTGLAQTDCHSDQQSVISRFWELEDGSDCGRFNIRGYRPISLSATTSDSVNRAPSSPTAGHTAASEQPYLTGEGRIQLSVRTKIASGFLTHDDPVKRDSLWFGYTQQSYWQIFAPSISRPFRITDHEPELMYIVPTDADLPGGWRLRYSGVSINHQSNGQALPLSRSWNRVILMAGAEKGERYTLTGRLWQRMPEDADSDDNPGISDYVGRAEVTGTWNVDKNNTLALTVRHSMLATANGSYRLEWMRALGNGNRGKNASGLRFHTQLFSGYGDSLLDYNYHRTVLSIGLSLVDW